MSAWTWVRLRFWLGVIDALPIGSRLYAWALRRAVECVEWVDPA